MHKTQSACSFCGKRSAEVRDLIASRRLGSAYICDECIETCRSILNDNRSKTGAYRLRASRDDLHLGSQVLECSFCRRSQRIVNKLVSSPQKDASQYICDRCVRWSAELLGKTEASAASRPQRLARWLKRRLGTIHAPVHRLPS